MLTYETINAFGKDASDAIVTSAKASAAGAEEFTKTYVALSKASVDRCVAAAKSLADVKTPDAALAVHSEFVREAMENAIADGKTLVDLTNKVFTEATAPLKARAEAVLDWPRKAA